MIILQPTSLCNLDCAYCYLPGRRFKQEMSPEVAEAVAKGINPEWAEFGPVELVWHGGEPLTVSSLRFVELLSPFTALRRAGVIQHVIQTNATLISDAWCDLFLEYGFEVGVSLDGPATLNHNRTDWRGRSVFGRIVSGIERLRARGISFDVIAVVDRGAVDNIGAVLDFLAALAPRSIALNLEEREGVNRHGQTPSPDEARRLWHDTFAWADRNKGVKIREVRRLLKYLGLSPPARVAREVHDPLPTVATNGDVVLLSPELLGISSPRYDDFVAGNVLRESLAEILSRSGELRYVQEFQEGVRRCEQECDYFAFCQGGHAGNRFFEHGTFTTTETDHCKITAQALVLGLADLVENGERQHDAAGDAG